MVDQEGRPLQVQENTVRRCRERKNLEKQPDVLKKYYCPKCPYESGRRNNVDRHIASMHSTSKQLLICCGQYFATKAFLLNHVRSSHASRGYVCTDCGRAFARRALLTRHSSVHTGIKTFHCNSCGYGTSHKTNLIRHCKAHGHPFPDTIDPQRHRKSYTSTTNGSSWEDSSPSHFSFAQDPAPSANSTPRTDLWQPWEAYKQNNSQTEELMNHHQVPNVTYEAARRDSFNQVCRERVMTEDEMEWEVICFLAKLYRRHLKGENCDVQ